MNITCDFYGGSIEVVSVHFGAPVRLRLRRDARTQFAQSFYFRVCGSRQAGKIIIEDVDQSTFSKGWVNYQAFTSQDQIHWKRCETSYHDGHLLLSHEPSPGATYYASFPPYQDTDHSALLAFCKSDARTSVNKLCDASETDTVELISVGSKGNSAPQIWILGRQHPGETQPSWWIDGFLRALLDPHNETSRRLLMSVRIHVVPNMNPDGSRIGNYRTNIHSHNLNASWDRATVNDTPSVYWVLKAMESIGIDFCLDIHGDEEIPFIFIASVDRKVPLPLKTLKALDIFERHLSQTEPFFKSQRLEREHIKASPASFCAPYLMKRFNIPALTLELPFKRYNADGFAAEEYGIEECMRSGRIAIPVLLKYFDERQGCDG